MSFIRRLFPSRPDSSIVEAERRWTAINLRKREAGCPCGKPATEVRYNGWSAGSVPVETWTCAEHVGAVGWRGRQPAWSRPDQCDNCAGLCVRMFRIGEDKPYVWHCPLPPVSKEPESEQDASQQRMFTAEDKLELAEVHLAEQAEEITRLRLRLAEETARFKSWAESDQVRIMGEHVDGALAYVSRDRDKLRGDSVALNSVMWRLAVALGDVEPGMELTIINSDELVDRAVSIINDSRK